MTTAEAMPARCTMLGAVAHGWADGRFLAGLPRRCGVKSCLSLTLLPRIVQEYYTPKTTKLLMDGYLGQRING